MPSLSERQAEIERATHPLPGSVPYENLRPIRVPQRCDGMNVLQWLDSMHTFYSQQEWIEDISRELLLRDGEVVSIETVVSAGQRFLHVQSNHMEPDVKAAIRLIYEDEAIVVVNKPAPLPMHPGGRFNRNSLGYILEQVFGETKLRNVHRLDASTSGVLVLCKTQHAAANLSRQFSNCEVDKLYLARVQGIPSEASFECDACISAQPGALGRRCVAANGDQAMTRFRLSRALDDGTSLIEARPLTGRTNQIRIHLAHLGFPICGDAVYSQPDQTNRPVWKTMGINDPPLCLQASRLVFLHPTTEKQVEFSAAFPAWSQP